MQFFQCVWVELKFVFHMNNLESQKLSHVFVYLHLLNSVSEICHFWVGWGTAVYNFYTRHISHGYCNLFNWMHLILWALILLHKKLCRALFLQIQMDWLPVSGFGLVLVLAFWFHIFFSCLAFFIIEFFSLLALLVLLTAGVELSRSHEWRSWSQW